MARKSKFKCECCDPGCPICRGKCDRPAPNHLFRIDMEDNEGTHMCDGCADDALDSGVFTTWQQKRGIH